MIEDTAPYPNKPSLATDGADRTRPKSVVRCDAFPLLSDISLPKPDR